MGEYLEHKEHRHGNDEDVWKGEVIEADKGSAGGSSCRRISIRRMMLLRVLHREE
jgi:hypothetical protein